MAYEVIICVALIILHFLQDMRSKKRGERENPKKAKENP